ncbi:SDR family NAD(P)-dependent oxidoreductase [Geodermatophilus sp. SYSU D01106]
MSRVLASAPPPSAALVTGASSGIGAALATALAGRGHDVVLVARRRDRLEDLAERLARPGIRVHALPCDLTDEDARGRLPDAVADLGLRISVLCTSAGVGLTGDLVTVPPERAAAVVRVNLEATVDLCARFVPDMVRRRSGAVLTVCSLVSLAPMPRMAVYAATKAALLSFSEALHAEVRSSNVAVTALCPGAVPTEFMELAGLAEGVARMPAWALDDAAEVAERGLDALARNRRVVVPSPLYRTSAMALRTLPHGVLFGLLGRNSPFPDGRATATAAPVELVGAPEEASSGR